MFQQWHFHLAQAGAGGIQKSRFSGFLVLVFTTTCISVISVIFVVLSCPGSGFSLAHVGMLLAEALVKWIKIPEKGNEEVTYSQVLVM